jgi:hypothetical protein
VDALDALPSVLKVTFLDTWKAVLREGLDWTDETREGSPHLSAWGTHPRGSSTQERDRGRRDQAEVPNQVRQAGHVINPRPSLCPFWVVEK